MVAARLLLDAHLSAKRIGGPLLRAGHDVLALAEHPEFDGLIDAQVLELAVEQRRILVTRNSKDFAPLLRVWAEAGRRHHGCILVWSVTHDHYAQIVSGVQEALVTQPKPADWRDLTVAI